MKASIRPVSKKELVQAFSRNAKPVEEFKKLWSIYTDVFIATPIGPSEAKVTLPEDPKDCFVPMQKNNNRDNNRQNQQ